MNGVAAGIANLLHRMANRVTRVRSVDWSFLDACQRDLGGIPQLDLDAIIHAYLVRDPAFLLVQVGAHQDGDVTLYKIKPSFWAERKFPEWLDSQIWSLIRSQ